MSRLSMQDLLNKALNHIKILKIDINHHYTETFDLMKGNDNYDATMDLLKDLELIIKEVIERKE